MTFRMARSGNTDADPRRRPNNGRRIANVAALVLLVCGIAAAIATAFRRANPLAFQSSSTTSTLPPSPSSSSASSLSIESRITVGDVVSPQTRGAVSVRTGAGPQNRRREAGSAPPATDEAKSLLDSAFATIDGDQSRCAGLNRKQCTKDPRCIIAVDGCVLKTNATGGGNEGKCAGISSKKRCKKDPACRYNRRRGYCHARVSKKSGKISNKGSSATPPATKAATTTTPAATPTINNDAQLDGGGGALPSDRSEPPPEKCPKGQCPSPKGGCGHPIQCFADPCVANPCNSTQVCSANYCGGCHAVCSPAPARPKNVLPPRPEKFWPMVSNGVHECVYSSKYPQRYLHVKVLILFDSYEDCCNTYSCDVDDTPGVGQEVTTAPTRVTGATVDGPRSPVPANCAVGPAAERLGVDPCPNSQFCQLGRGACMPPDPKRNGTTYFGLCVTKPDICMEMYEPVCGCDGRTYENECKANGAGRSVSHKGKCGEDSPLPFDGDGDRVTTEPTGVAVEVTVRPAKPAAGDPPPRSAGCAVGDDQACAKDQYCEVLPGTCDAASKETLLGKCAKRPEACPMIFSPICGCDNQTYNNPCLAGIAGASISHRGACSPPPLSPPHPGRDIDPGMMYVPSSADAGSPHGIHECFRLSDVDKVHQKAYREAYSDAKAYREAYSDPEGAPLPLFQTYEECCATFPCASGGDGVEPWSKRDADLMEKYFPGAADTGTSNGIHECLKLADAGKGIQEAFLDMHSKKPEGAPLPLFQTYEECCATFPCASGGDGVEPWSKRDADLMEKYFPGAADTGTSNGIHECLKLADAGKGIQEAFLDMHSKKAPLLFESYEECCAVFPCASGGAVAVLEPIDPAPYLAALPASTEPAQDDPGRDDPMFMLEMHQGFCFEDAHCEGGLICHQSSGKCVCDTSTNQGCAPGQICDVPAARSCFLPDGCPPACTCDYNSEAVDGSNGCPVGEICREGCAIADRGPQCFKSNEQRDCGFMGRNYMCKDSNGDGVIDRNDYAMGCVEIPPLEGSSPENKDDAAGNASLSAATPSPKDVGGPELTIPLSDISSDPQGTLETSDGECPDGHCLSPYDVCGVRSDGSDCFVDPCSNVLCVVGMTCKHNYCGGCYATCSPTTAEDGMVPKPEYWWPTKKNGAWTCVHGSHYPGEFASSSAHLLFATRDKCCSIYSCSDGGIAANLENWWPTVEGGKRTCIFSFDYPDYYAVSLFPLLFETRVECCATYGCDGGSVGPKLEHWWPTEEGGKRTCIFSSEYPDNYASSSLPLVFETRTECCATYECPGGTVGTKVEHWWPTEEGGKRTCIFSSEYPDNYASPSFPLVFETREECCAAFPTACQTAMQTAMPTASPISVPRYWYPQLVNEVKRCINDGNYPPIYHARPDLRASLLFETEVDCCTTYPLACPSHFWYPLAGRSKSTECMFGDDYSESIRGNENYLFFSEESCCARWCGVELEVKPTKVVTENVPATTAATAVTTMKAVVTATTAASTVATTTATTMAAAIDVVSTDAPQTTAATAATTTEAVVTATTAATTAATTTATTMTAAIDVASTDAPQTTAATAATTTKAVVTATTAATTAAPTNATTMPAAIDVASTDAPQTVPTEPTSPTLGSSSSSNCNWHKHMEVDNTCTNSGKYPLLWDRADLSTHVLYDTSLECCEGEFPDHDCAIELHECAPVLQLDPSDDVLTDIPWDFGTPAEWRMDNKVSSLGDLNSYSSVTNIPAVGVGNTSDLTLRLHVPHRATLRCQALIQVHMPFDMFSLFIDGIERHQYFEDVEGWTEILAGFNEGYHKVTFRVKNADFIAGFDREDDYGWDYGSGKVWLDHCEIQTF